MHTKRRAVLIALSLVCVFSASIAIAILLSSFNDTPIDFKAHHNLHTKSTDTKEDRMLKAALVVNRIDEAIARKTELNAEIGDEEGLSSRNQNEPTRKLEEQRQEAVSAIAWDETPAILETMLEEEPQNPSWTEEIEEYARKALLEETQSGTQLLDVDCRERLCVVRLSHENEAAFTTFKNSASNNGPWLGGNQFGFGNENEDGSMVSSVYFTQKGTEGIFTEIDSRLLEIVVDDEQFD